MSLASGLEFYSEPQARTGSVGMEFILLILFMAACLHRVLVLPMKREDNNERRYGSCQFSTVVFEKWHHS